MDFPKFARKLKNVIGGASSQSKFTKTIFETMMNDNGPELIKNISKNTFKSYFNGSTGLSNIASIVLANLSEDDGFISYIDGFGEITAQMLADEFEDDITDIGAANASIKLNELFLCILKEATSRKKISSKNTKNNADTSTNNLSQKVLASGQALADAWENAVKKIADCSALVIPAEQPTDEFPYSPEDKLLLQDFTADYDDIMMTLIGENYGEALISMTLQNKIQNLYQSTWSTKAGDFQNLELKSYVFGLLGELNTLCNNFFSEGVKSPSINKIRTKIRNLYVKLHPNQFMASFPYDAFIDDWNDGE